MNSCSYLFVLLLLSAAACPRAGAQAAPGEGYAIVVGSNLGGPGQEHLRYSEHDAWLVADVLTSIGGFPAEHVERLMRPTVWQLMAALERVRAQIAERARRGEQSRFVFYYSGHSRADALNLGAELLPLKLLRERIVGTSAALSIVVLDACQSGAFSRAKGAEPTADFSFNSVGQLNTQGIAVIASSSEQELSQESEQLHSSYFTHHWLVALRGGGDRDADGRVTLSEAYQYAYNHTLATTAATKIGEQHATLETNLTGKDDVALTQPSAASARLLVPESYHGRVLLQNLPSWGVFADLDKVTGQAIRLAVPAGTYAATLRGDGPASRCEFALRDGAETLLQVSGCRVLSEEELNPKGGPPRGDEGFVFEVSGGLGGGTASGDYAKRLRAFDFSRDESAADLLRFHLAAGRRLHPNLLVGIDYYNLQARAFARDVSGVKQNFAWNAHALNLFVQGDLPVSGPRVRLFARAGAGMSIAWTSFDALQRGSEFSDMNPSLTDTTQNSRVVTQHFVRPCGFAGIGVLGSFTSYVGYQFELRYAFAPAIKNDFSEREDLGGFSFLAGVRLRTWE